MDYRNIFPVSLFPCDSQQQQFALALLINICPEIMSLCGSLGFENNIGN